MLNTLILKYTAFLTSWKYDFYPRFSSYIFFLIKLPRISKAMSTMFIITMVEKLIFGKQVHGTLKF